MCTENSRDTNTGNEKRVGWFACLLLTCYLLFVRRFHLVCLCVFFVVFAGILYVFAQKYSVPNWAFTKVCVCDYMLKMFLVSSHSKKNHNIQNLLWFRAYFHFCLRFRFRLRIKFSCVAICMWNV